jgi:hypothetical protein
MNLSDEAIAHIQTEVTKSMTAPGYVEPQNISADSIGNNKDLILGFLTTLIAVIPSVFGKLAAQGVKVAAEAWFKNKGY